MIGKRGLLAVVATLGLGFGQIHDAAAQFNANRTVMLVVPLAAGGAIDVLCRLLAEKLRAGTGQQFIVENRTGAGGNIASEYVAKATPNGHYLLCAPSPSFTVHLLYSKLSFDPRAFEPVSVFAKFSMVLVGRADLPFGNVPQLIAYARAHPGQLSYASQGLGQFSHLTLEALKTMANIEIQHVPYRGGTLAFNDMFSGQVDLYAGSLAQSIAHINSGKLKLLGVTGRARLAAYPDVPALFEAVPGLEADDWLGIAAPPGTPKNIIENLFAAIAIAVASPDIKARFSDLQTEPLATTPAQMQDMIRRATEQWSGVIASAKIRLD